MKRAAQDFGALLVDKPRGPSSHELVQWVRWSLSTSSVGHCGTLDPDASGLMVVLVGKATRLASRLSAQRKVYDALFALGAQTETDDAQGEVMRRAEVTPEDLQAAQSIIQEGWQGLHRLAPPRYSAIRVDGVRAHQAAREGKALKLNEREMEIFRSQLLSAAQEKELRTQMESAVAAEAIADCVQLGARLDVSKGSYIRSLALELGQRVGVPAHLALLRRLRCGPAKLEDPRVLRGLSAIPWTPAPNGAPRWRIRWGEGDKAEQARKLRSALIAPFELLELPILRELAPKGPQAQQLQPCLQGQCVDVQALTLPFETGCQRWIWLQPQQAVILRRDPATESKAERWAPELLLRWPASCASSKSLPQDATKS